jgi:predicted transcriptional regulator of viral defense system
VKLAAQQFGVISHDQLLSIGLDPAGIERRLCDGRLDAIHRGVYRIGGAELSQRGRWLAAVLAYGSGTLLSHRSAAALWGLEKVRGALIDVTATSGRQGILRRERIWLHRGQLHSKDETRHNGIPVTTVARTLFDMAEFVAFKRLESAWEEADRLNLLELKLVERVCERGRGRRALKPIRRLLVEAVAATITRSPLEDAFAAFCADNDLAIPSFNTSALGFEVDALWPQQRVAAELDSWEFHRHRAAFERDRARDAALQAAGYRTIRITHRRLQTDPHLLADQLRALLARRV